MPQKSDHRAFLAQTRLLAALAPPVLAAVAEAVTESRFTAGQLIFSRGDTGDAVFLVLSGRVRLSTLTADGRELSFTHATKGDVFGEIAAIDGSPRSADATALTEVRALTLSSTHLERLIIAYPALGWAFMRFLCARLRDVSGHLEDIALLPLEARLARFLLVQLGAGATAPRTLALGMSQSELALLLGASRQKVNGALASLQRAVAITRVGADLSCDPERLRHIAQME